MFFKKIILVIFFFFFLVSVSADYLFRNGDFEGELNSNDWNIFYYGTPYPCTNSVVIRLENENAYHGFKDLRIDVNLSGSCTSAVVSVLSKTFLKRFTPYYFYLSNNAYRVRLYDCNSDFLNNYDFANCSLRQTLFSDTSWVKISDTKIIDGYIVVQGEFTSYTPNHFMRLDFFNYILEGGTFPLSNDNLTHTPEPVDVGETLIFKTNDVNTMSKLACGLVDTNSFNECVSTSYSLNPQCEMVFNYISDKNFQCKVYTDDGRESTTMYNYVSFSGKGSYPKPSNPVPVGIVLSSEPTYSLRKNAKNEPFDFMSKNNVVGFITLTNMRTLQSFDVPSFNLDSESIILLEPETTYKVEFKSTHSENIINSAYFTTHSNPYIVMFFYVFYPAIKFSLNYENLTSSQFSCSNNSSSQGTSYLQFYKDSQLIDSDGCITTTNLNQSFLNRALPIASLKDVSIYEDGSIFSNPSKFDKYDFKFSINYNSNNYSYVFGHPLSSMYSSNHFYDFFIDVFSQYFPTSESVLLNQNMSPNVINLSSSSNLYKDLNMNSVECVFAFYPTYNQTIDDITMSLIARDMNDNFFTLSSFILTSDYPYSNNPLIESHTFDFNSIIYSSVKNLYCSAYFKQKNSAVSSWAEFIPNYLYSDRNSTINIAVKNTDGVSQNVSVVSWNGNDGVINVVNNLTSESFDVNLLNSTSFSVLGNYSYTINYYDSLSNQNRNKTFYVDVNEVKNVVLFVASQNNRTPFVNISTFAQSIYTPFVSCVADTYDNDLDLNYFSFKIYDSDLNLIQFIDSNDYQHYLDLKNSNILSECYISSESGGWASNFFSENFLKQCSSSEPCKVECHFFNEAFFFDVNEIIKCSANVEDEQGHKNYSSKNLVWQTITDYTNVICSADEYLALDFGGYGHTNYVVGSKVPISCKICYTGTANPLNFIVKWHNSDLNFITTKEFSNEFCSYYSSNFYNLPVGTYANEKVDINSSLGYTFAIMPQFTIYESSEQQYGEEQQQYLNMCVQNVGVEGEHYKAQCNSELCVFFKTTAKNFTCFVWGLGFFALNNFVGFVITSFVVLIFIAVIYILFFRR